MKIFISHSSNYDFQDELYRPLREPDLNSKHEIILPHEDGQDVITKDIIQDCDLVVAEVSHPSTGQGIELGWADMFNIPIVCIHKEGIEPSRSLRKITDNFIAYKDSNDMISKLSEYISKK
ncbi:MAG TPA: hypothetical protein VJC15_00755 [Candidatus Paceibacterota bacterium]